MVGPGICVLCLADTCTSEVHPVFNPVAPYGYLLSDMYFLWQISQIQTFLFEVVGPGLVSTSPAFVGNIASHPAGPHGRHAQKTVNRAPLLGAGRYDTICTAACVRCDSSTACRLCCLKPILRILPTHQTTSNHTMSAVISQSLSTALTVISANIEG